MKDGVYKSDLTVRSYLKISIRESFSSWFFEFRGRQTQGSFLVDHDDKIYKNDVKYSKFYTSDRFVKSPTDKNKDLYFIIDSTATKFCGESCHSNKIVLLNKYLSFGGKLENNLDIEDIKQTITPIFYNIAGSDSPIFFNSILDDIRADGYYKTLQNGNKVTEAGNNMGNYLMQQINCSYLEKFTRPCTEPDLSLSYNLDLENFNSTEDIELLNSSMTGFWDDISITDSETYFKNSYFERLGYFAEID